VSLPAERGGRLVERERRERREGEHRHARESLRQVVEQDIGARLVEEELVDDG